MTTTARITFHGGHAFVAREHKVTVGIPAMPSPHQMKVVVLRGSLTKGPRDLGGRSWTVGGGRGVVRTGNWSTVPNLTTLHPGQQLVPNPEAMLHSSVCLSSGRLIPHEGKQGYLRKNGQTQSCWIAVDVTWHEEIDGALKLTGDDGTILEVAPDVNGDAWLYVWDPDDNQCVDEAIDFVGFYNLLPGVPAADRVVPGIPGACTLALRPSPGNSCVPAVFEV